MTYVSCIDKTSTHLNKASNNSDVPRYLIEAKERISVIAIEYRLKCLFLMTVRRNL